MVDRKPAGQLEGSSRQRADTQEGAGGGEIGPGGLDSQVHDSWFQEVVQVSLGGGPEVAQVGVDLELDALARGRGPGFGLESAASQGGEIEGLGELGDLGSLEAEAEIGLSQDPEPTDGSDHGGDDLGEAGLEVEVHGVIEKDESLESGRRAGGVKGAIPELPGDRQRVSSDASALGIDRFELEPVDLQHHGLRAAWGLVSQGHRLE